MPASLCDSSSQMLPSKLTTSLKQCTIPGQCNPIRGDFVPHEISDNIWWPQFRAYYGHLEGRGQNTIKPLEYTEQSHHIEPWTQLCQNEGSYPKSLLI